MGHRTGAGAAINPDSIASFWVTVSAVIVVFLSSAAISFMGLYQVGLDQGLPRYMAWLTPVMIDSSIIVFTMAALIFRSRGRRMAMVSTRVAVGLVTVISMTLNSLHSYYAIGIDTVQSATATIVNGLAPLFIFVSTEALVTLITKQPPAKREPAPAPARKKAPARKPATTRAPKAPAEPRPEPSALPTPPRPSGSVSLPGGFDDVRHHDRQPAAIGSGI